jgi:hypothetical protein
MKWTLGVAAQHIEHVRADQRCRRAAGHPRRRRIGIGDPPGIVGGKDSIGKTGEDFPVERLGNGCRRRLRLRLDGTIVHLAACNKSPPRGEHAGLSPIRPTSAYLFENGAQLGDADRLRERADHRQPVGGAQSMRGIENLRIEPADDEDPRLARLLGQKAQKLDPIDLRHDEIEDDDIG